MLGGRPQATYDLLDDAIANGSARVNEVGEGSVLELRFRNDGERPVLLADGEELIGAIQNRSLNLTILVPALTAITIPVSCTESGRWGYQPEDENDDAHGAAAPSDFRRGENVLSANARMSRDRAVPASLRASRGAARNSDQSEVWGEIDRLSTSLQAPSETSALDDTFTRYRDELDGYAEALTLPEGACGAIFSVAGGPSGVDLFDAWSTFTALYPKLLRSWALQCAAVSWSRSSRDSAETNPHLLIDRLARRRCRTYPATGLGVDARITRRGSRLHGSALTTEHLIHLAAFYDVQA